MKHLPAEPSERQPSDEAVSGLFYKVRRSYCSPNARKTRRSKLAAPQTLVIYFVHRSPKPKRT